MNIIEAAAEAGASGYTFSTHSINLQILAELKQSDILKDEFELYPVLPYAQGYVRLANEKGMRGLVNETLSKLPVLDRARSVLETGFSALRLDPIGLMKSYLDLELQPYLNVKPENSNIRSVLLHEVVTDLCLGLRNVRMLGAFAQHIRESYHASPGFVTYNLVRFVEVFRQAGLALKDMTIMTPFNSIGYQMSQSRQSCEDCLSALDGGDVIAMSIMAGGYSKLDEAVSYISGLTKLFGVAVGVSSEEHARDTFAKLRGMVQESTSHQHVVGKRRLQ
ncbi:MAG: hypothetical protein ABSF00_07605 [Candidatus Bathyarchaeia archaeon]